MSEAMISRENAWHLILAVAFQYICYALAAIAMLAKMQYDLSALWKGLIMPIFAHCLRKATTQHNGEAIMSGFAVLLLIFLGVDHLYDVMAMTNKMARTNVEMNGGITLSAQNAGSFFAMAPWQVGKLFMASAAVYTMGNSTGTATRNEHRFFAYGTFCLGLQGVVTWAMALSNAAPFTNPADAGSLAMCVFALLLGLEAVRRAFTGSDAHGLLVVCWISLMFLSIALTIPDGVDAQIANADCSFGNCDRRRSGEDDYPAPAGYAPAAGGSSSGGSSSGGSSSGGVHSDGFLLCEAFSLLEDNLHLHSSCAAFTILTLLGDISIIFVLVEVAYKSMMKGSSAAAANAYYNTSMSMQPPPLANPAVGHVQPNDQRPASHFDNFHGSTA